MSESNANQDSNGNSFVCGVVEGFYGRPWTTEQRKDLFSKMKNLGLNTYMYAPKDDFKHRAYWRELYSVEEAEQLSSLIQAAKENGIEFYYALSPGLDIAYSSPKEVACLKRKLEQVQQFGCNAFALLFDDIEPEISETDKEIFQSFGHAQVSVTNEVYQSLGNPKFLFCPTEYCSTRAVPNVQNSDYLNIIGAKLIHNISIMWTGNKVISKTISIQSIQELSEVLKRQPVIWDNLHANDYDQKRLFLGPYSGRSTDLIPHLRGVLTNPNCEFEPNFIAIHTLSQWSKCSSDAKCELSSVSADIKLESESESGSFEDIPSHLSPTTYHPRRALNIAIQHWLPEFNKPKTAFGKAGNVVTASLASVIPSLSVAPPTTVKISKEGVMSKNGVTETVSNSQVSVECAQESNCIIETNFTPITKELANSLVNPPVILNPLEPMDCNPSPNISPKHLSDAQMEETNTKSDSSTTESQVASTSDSQPSKEVRAEAEEMQTEPVECDDIRQNVLTTDDVSLLVDLFYLPFEHGNQGLQFLSEFQWLKANSHVVSEFRRRNTSDPETPEVTEWYAKAAKFEEMTQSVSRLLTRLTFCKNRSLLYDLYPYVWDVKGVISLLNSYVKWLALGRIPTAVPGFVAPTFTLHQPVQLTKTFAFFNVVLKCNVLLGFSKGYKEAFTNGDQEPWIFRGGLTGELQRLLPVESVSDLFLYKPPESPSSRIYTIRPYLHSDEQSIYDVCRKTQRDYGTFPDDVQEIPNLLVERFVGGYLNLSPEYCFVVEDENGVCGYVLAALDIQQFQKKVEVAWFANKLVSGNGTGGEIDSESGASSRKFDVPEVVSKTHPSIIRINLLNHVLDLSVPKRLLACVLAALKANGSHGVFSKVAVRDKNLVDFYLKLGFQEIQCPPELRSVDEIFLGRII